MRKLVIAIVMASIGAMPATAQVRTGYTAIAAGSLTEAERTLTRERAIFPQRPELMLNLAAVYARTDRSTEARALYADVLRAEPVALELADGTAESSHLLARRGLMRLDTTIAAR
ncbi:hypothetical protein ASG29_08190 [Sphingomonas sp. Leaf412]|uniref:tetratricopeptide repeat protein n=1 Tax=Sphingomonas sp. Leaf412 TaxID=1736370 RepID=UPI000701599C|nr:tetratricopeptide repeat protein [Sphingomonas sp. Leaf412]KQT31863.1 hypothetical protein ASG29_08190 [Sphingomonas sp. Leaf412]